MGRELPPDNAAANSLTGCVCTAKFTFSQLSLFQHLQTKLLAWFSPVCRFVRLLRLACLLLKPWLVYIAYDNYKLNINNNLGYIAMTKLVRFSPNRELGRMQNEIDRLFSDFFPSRHYSFNNEKLSSWAPRVDVSEHDDGYAISLDLPGMNKKDIVINYQDGVLNISGERQVEDKKEGHNFLRIERRAGAFSRSFNIPQAIQTDKINATYKDGVLHVALLKAEEVKPIKVNVA